MHMQFHECILAADEGCVVRNALPLFTIEDVPKGSAIILILWLTTSCLQGEVESRAQQSKSEPCTGKLLGWTLRHISGGSTLPAGQPNR